MNENIEKLRKIISESDNIVFLAVQGKYRKQYT